MTETVVVTQAGTVPSVTGVGGTQPTYSGAGFPTVSGPVASEPASQSERPDEHDPVLAWLISDESTRYRNHWVALNPVTGALLGLADEVPHLRRWQAEGALILFVDPPSRAQLSELADFYPLEPPESLEFRHHRSYRGLHSPRMVVEFRSRGPRPRNELLGRTPVLVLVDSGADVTMLPKRFAVPLRIPLDDMAVEEMRGAGSIRVPCYPRVDLEARLCGKWVTLPVRFFATEDRKGGILGREGAFDAMLLTFDHSQERMYAARSIARGHPLG